MRTAEIEHTRLSDDEITQKFFWVLIAIWIWKAEWCCKEEDFTGDEEGNSKSHWSRRLILAFLLSWGNLHIKKFAESQRSTGSNCGKNEFRKGTPEQKTVVRFY